MYRTDFKTALVALVILYCFTTSSATEKENASKNNDPPPSNELAKMARYITKQSNWSSIATLSTMKVIAGYPFANVISISDGPIDGKSTGIPYMYLTPFDFTVQDLKNDPRASMMMTLAQGSYCKGHSFDEKDPRCAHVILTGKIETVTDAKELEIAKEALFTRHTSMSHWPKDHGWYFAKMNASSIFVQDYFGGPAEVSTEDYYNSDI